MSSVTSRVRGIADSGVGAPRTSITGFGRSASTSPSGDGPATIGTRTEHVRIRKAENGRSEGTVTWIEHLGDQDHLHIALADRDFITLSDPDAGLAVGDRVSIGFAKPLFFDAEGRRLAG